MDIPDFKIYDDDSGTVGQESIYAAGVARKRRMLLVSASALLALILISLVVNNIDYPVGDVLATFLTHDTSGALGRYVWKLDVPVIAAAILSGAGLSLAGVVMQCILRNPLASPYTLGLSSASAFGAAFAIIVFEGGTAAYGIYSGAVTPLCAFIFAMAATGIVLVLTKMTRVSSETMVLAGIAVSAIFSAGLTLMQYLADPVQLSSIVSWTFGNLRTATPEWDLVLFAAVSVIAVYFMVNRWTLNAMNAGDEVARGLGVNTGAVLIIGLTLSGLLSAVVVSQFGVIAFVGLLGPHMARMMMGDDHRFLIPGSMLAGAILMLAANEVASNIVLPVLLPVGLLTSLLGGPMFIILLIRRYRR